MGERLTRRWQRWLYWLQAEIVAMATDLAEVIGGAIALNLLFDLPLLAGGVITGTVSMIVLGIHSRRDTRPFERVIIAMMAIIAIGFSAGIFIHPPDAGATVAGLVPRFEGSGSVLLAASILGATIMPHAIYAHSALTRDRFGLVAPGSRRRLILRATRADVTIALAIAGTVNLVILLLAAATLAGGRRHRHAGGRACGAGGVARSARGDPVRDRAARLRTRLHLGGRLCGRGDHARPAARAHPAARCAGWSPSSRRWASSAIGFDPTSALVLSQVVLSFGIPFALIPLVILTAQRSLLGESVNRWYTTVAASITAAMLVALNIALLVLLLGG